MLSTKLGPPNYTVTVSHTKQMVADEHTAHESNEYPHIGGRITKRMMQHKSALDSVSWLTQLTLASDDVC